MTEIPEHLLQRSRERRAALGGEGGSEGDGQSAAAAPSSGAAEAGDSGAGSGDAPSAAVPAVAASAPAASAASGSAAPAVIDEPPSPIMLADREVRRTRVPIWAVPVLVVLPFWAILYAGAFGDRGGEGPVDPAVLGPRVYAANCSSCHGGAGEGGVGPALANGGAKITFPAEADHVDWVKQGSLGRAKGTPYGDPARAGGQRTIQAGVMPGFAATLSPAEIDAVVQFEREKL
ncbi:MAG: hypothetical protein QOI20_3038 [Acidimicrobiaceae bacterium]|nr:hypothetical protein [Acidimicrobiaceae bacterium]